MVINIEKIININLLQRAAWFTSGKEVKADLGKWYKSEHSPIRTQLFWIEMEDIPTFVSVHLVRHKIGVEHYVKSNRKDRGGDGAEDRNTPVNHAMLINAQTLINMARKRLCGKASVETKSLMFLIKRIMKTVDPDLADYLVPECEYRGKCCEFKPCK